MCEREIERERESERQRARKRERERDQRDSSWFSVQARVRAEMNHFVDPSISTRRMKKVASKAHFKSTKIENFSKYMKRI